MKEDVFKHAKRIILDGSLDYPEKAMYENFIKYNASYWLEPFGCHLVYNNFGISVIPDIFDDNIHDKVLLKTYHNGLQYTQMEFLPHQIYLDDLVFKLWQAEIEGKECKFTITCIRKKSDEIEIN